MKLHAVWRMSCSGTPSVKDREDDTALVSWAWIRLSGLVGQSELDDLIAFIIQSEMVSG